MQELDEKILWFFDKVEKLLESQGFTWIGDDDTMFCKENIGYVEESFEKAGDGRYIDIDLKLLLDEDCNPIKVEDIIIYDDDNVLSDDLYNRIMDLYKKFFID